MVGMVIQTREWSILATRHGYYSISNDSFSGDNGYRRYRNEEATAVSNPSLIDLLQDYFEHPEEIKV